LLSGLLLSLLLIAPGLRAEVRASLDRDNVYPGDTVTLAIETSGDDAGNQPDLTPLKKDFDILGTSRSRQIQIINGRRSDKHQWLVELSPKHNGRIEVPALPVGKHQTPVLALQVKDQQAAPTATAGAPVFIQAEAKPTDGATYVQQQVRYTTRLYYRVPLIEGDFSAPQLKDAVVERLGDDHQYQTTLNGRRYQVLERRYALFPAHSGRLTIPAAVFTGRTVSAAGGHDPFNRMDSLMQRMLGRQGFNDNFLAGTPFGDPGKRIHLRGDAVTLNIQPQPTTYTGHDWLPTSQLTLTDSWAKSAPTFVAGEPVTRTVTLEAKGLEAAQLPTVTLPDIPGVRYYPEQPVPSNRTDGDWIYGRSEQTMAYVATRPGKLTLPAVRVDWWDSVKQKQQTAVLPAWEVSVAPGKQSNAGTPPPATAPATPAPAQNTAQQAATKAPAKNTNTGKPTPKPVALENQGVWLLPATIVALVILLFGVYRWRRRDTAQQAANTPAVEKAVAVDNSALKQARQAIQSACSQNDPQATAAALLHWAAQRWPQHPPRNLSALAGRVTRGGDSLHELERSLYARHTTPWSGQTLWQTFVNDLEPAATSKQTQKNTDGPPPLYPDWNKGSL